MKKVESMLQATQPELLLDKFESKKTLLDIILFTRTLNVDGLWLILAYFTNTAMDLTPTQLIRPDGILIEDLTIEEIDKITNLNRILIDHLTNEEQVILMTIPDLQLRLDDYLQIIKNFRVEHLRDMTQQSTVEKVIFLQNFYALHTPELHIEIRQSEIPGAQWGLFATADIPDNEFITEYGGILIDCEPKQGSFYIIKPPEHVESVRNEDKYDLDGERMFYLFQFGRWANSSHWNRAPTIVGGVKVETNANYFVDYPAESQYKNEIYKTEVWAIRNITNGEEILTNYGDTYVVVEEEEEEPKRQRTQFCIQCCVNKAKFAMDGNLNILLCGKKCFRKYLKKK